MFRQAGVIQVDTLDEMFDVAQLLAYQPLPHGRRVAVVGNSDALGLLAADAASAAGLEVREPVALGSEASAEDFERALDEAIDDPGVDAVVAVYIPPLEATGEDVAMVLATVGEQSDKPIVSTFLGREGVPELLRVPDVEGAPGRGSVPSYPAPEAAVRALARVVAYAQWLGRPAGEVRAFPEIDTPTARRVVEGVLVRSPEGADLTHAQSCEVLRAYGIDLWDQIEVDSAASAVAAGERLGWNVVLKAHAEHLRTRPDMFYVWRNIDGEDEMRQAWEGLTEGLDDPREGRFVVQRQAKSGVPVTIEGLEDPLFGPLVSFGLSGAPSELLHDRAWRIPPMTDADAASMVREIRSAPLLMGYRGAEQVDLTAVEDLVQRIARLKNDLPQLAWVDLGLVLVNAEGAGVLDAHARVAPSGASRGELFARRLARMPGDTLG